MKFRSRKIDNYEMKKRMQGKLFIKTSEINSRKNLIANKDWVTIGVIVKQLNPQTSKNVSKIHHLKHQFTIVCFYRERSLMLFIFLTLKTVLNLSAYFYSVLFILNYIINLV